MSKKLISIAIPFYNGFDSICKIINELVSTDIDIYEIIISDDCSDIIISNKLQKLIFNINNNNIVYERSHTNLGMDLNFCKCITMSNATYTWFMGQDDFIFKENLLYVISQLIIYKPNVAYLNYLVKRSWNYNKTFIHTNNLNLEYGQDINQYYKVTKKNLPHFLPSLIVMNKLWPTDNIIQKYLNTHFIQLGAFLHILSVNGNWLYIGKPMSIGVIPHDGWQNNLEKSVLIYIGFMKCIINSKLNYKNLHNICTHQYFKNHYQHLILSLDCKINNKYDLLHKLKDNLYFTFNYRLITEIIIHTPYKIAIFLFFIKSKMYLLKNKI